MMNILGISGSTRSQSWNTKLLKIALAGAEQAGAQTTCIDLREFDLPLYDGDFEDTHGLPKAAMELKALFKTHQGLLIASPEYNSSFSGVLKNAIDWLSRSAPDETTSLASFQGKIAVLMSASPGALGGLRGLVQLRMVLSNINVLVLPEQIAVGGANKAFDDNNQLMDAKKQESIINLGKRLVDVVRKIHV